MSEAKSGKNHPMYGKIHSEETKQKISEAHSGEKNYNFISPIIAENITTGEKIIEYSERKIAKLLNVNFTPIHRRLNKNSKHYTEKPVLGIWKVYRLYNNDEEVTND